MAEKEKTIEQQLDDKQLKAVMIMNDLQRYCLENKIPMFATIAVNIEKDGFATQVPRAVTPLTIRKNIINDKITKFKAAVNNEFYLKIVDTRAEDLADMFDGFVDDEI